MSAKRGQRRTAAASVTGTYVVCLDCGREFPYDWNRMKVVSAGKESYAEATDSAYEIKAA